MPTIPGMTELMYKGSPNAVCVIIKESLVEIDVSTTICVSYCSSGGPTVSEVADSQFLDGISRRSE